MTDCPAHDRNQEAASIIRDLLRGGEHEGPCRNHDGQDESEWYDDYDSCALHLAAAESRRQRALEWLAENEKP